MEFSGLTLAMVVAAAVVAGTVLVALAGVLIDRDAERHDRAAGGGRR